MSTSLFIHDCNHVTVQQKEGSIPGELHTTIKGYANKGDAHELVQIHLFGGSLDAETPRTLEVLATEYKERGEAA